MTLRNLVLLGCAIGLITSLVVLALMSFGVSGTLAVHHTDWMCVVWPASILLIVGWKNTPVGAAIIVASMVLNCLMYSAIALLVQRCVRSMSR